MGLRPVLTALMLITNVCSVSVHSKETVLPRSTTTAIPPKRNKPSIVIGPEPSPDALLNWNLLPTESCGQIPSNRTVAGNKSHSFEFPWMVMLRYQTDDGFINGCGGSLINNRYVLTAAHCVKTWSGDKLVTVCLGEHDTSSTENCIHHADGERDCAGEIIEIDVEEMIVHHGFIDPLKLLHDIALIRMAKKVEYSNAIHPICLPVDDNVRQHQPFRYTTTGWSKAEEATSSKVLLQKSVNHVPLTECQRRMNVFYLPVKLIPQTHICAIGEDLQSFCNAESGGPLGANIIISDRTKYVQFGVYSSGSLTCRLQNVPGVYMRVSGYMEWIVANMRP